MMRSQGFSIALTLWIVPALCVTISAQDESEQTRRPNIVLIMTDDAGVDAFSCYGSTSCQTPEIDRLARDGMRFLHAYSQPLCTPTRVKLLTGKSNARNYSAFSVLKKGERTFAHALKDRGYRSCVVGKWQLLGAEHYKANIRGKGQTPTEAGFDEWRLWQVRKLGKRYWRPQFETNGKLETAARDAYGPDLYTEFMLDFIERHKDGPFLAYYPMALPHNPFLPTPRSVAENPEIDVTKRGKQNFVSMMSHVDILVGRIRRKLESLGIAKNTILLVTSDNGTNRQIRSRIAGIEIQGGKGETRRAGSHVPLIAYWPETVAAGSTCSDLIDFSDFFATFTALAGAPTTTEEARTIDGRSFLAQLLGKAGKAREALFCHYHPRPITRKKSRAQRYAFDKRYKLYADGRFFDMDTDPDEKAPLRVAAAADENTARAERRARLAAVLANAPKPFDAAGEDKK